MCRLRSYLLPRTAETSPGTVPWLREEVDPRVGNPIERCHWCHWCHLVPTTTWSRPWGPCGDSVHDTIQRETSRAMISRLPGTMFPPAAHLFWCKQWHGGYRQFAQNVSYSAPEVSDYLVTQQRKSSLIRDNLRKNSFFFGAWGRQLLGDQAQL